MIFIYNILQFVILALFWPLLLLGVLAKKKYRQRFAARMGYGLTNRLPSPTSDALTFWIHALSVGEVTSAVPLISGIRKRWPECKIVVTVTTSTGLKIAKSMLQESTDHILSSPVDIRPVISLFIHRIKPNIFIQVETDFWPNQLHMLHQSDIPTVLVNGRISETSYNSYKKYGFFFKPMFLCFNHLCMQTEKDRLSMASLGIPESSLHTLGNLKFDTELSSQTDSRDYSSFLPADSLVITAGSTHPGEEEVLLSVLSRMLSEFPKMYLVIVPRDPARGDAVKALAAGNKLQAVLRSDFQKDHGDLLIVDTIGELIDFYHHCQIAFVGGSLVAQGGHNPIEPALFSVPVIFGPHMEDFNEIAGDLKDCGGGAAVASPEQLESLLRQLLEQPDKRLQMGQAASNCIEDRKGVIHNHLELLNSLL